MEYQVLPLLSSFPGSRGTSPLRDPKLAGTAGFSPVLSPPGSSLGLTCPPRWAALDLSSHTVIGLVGPIIPQTLQTTAVWTDD